MPPGILQRRQAKAARRKKLLAERRKLAHAEATLSLAGRVRRLAAAPVHACFIHDGLFERGNGTVLLARGTAGGRLALAVFLIDVFCLGVKDVLFDEIDASDLEAIITAMEEGAPFVAVDPAYARKLLRDLAAYARSIGFEPHESYAAVELLFGDCSSDACDASFRFGHDGKPVYIPGPSETSAQIRRRLEHLRRRFGDGAFDFIVPDDGGEEEDLGDLEEWQASALEDGSTKRYDPAEAPDPTEWLSLGEEERQNLALEYHRRAGIPLPNHRLHAVFHVVIENQIALGDELPVRRTIERLTADGLDRHEAIHAIASALAEYMNDIVQGAGAVPPSHEAYNTAVERLTVESWRRKWESDDDTGEP